ncbi:hypothetical protein [Chryseobacterium lathyri]|uniref:Uncharacterized protein n=1 Tax=Chryseobacterium lathyri TaxID=395933 RepID=A0ABT9SID2_9FLAO|nr:hypothetical protein [Chryseobacterium lathyri]MDP9959177.1 hypothetical protein [Chryseobacterium lathyri]
MKKQTQMMSMPAVFRWGGFLLIRSVQIKEVSGNADDQYKNNQCRYYNA